MPQAKLLRDKIAELQQQVIEIRKQQKQLIDDTIASCPHAIEDILESKYHSGVLFTDAPVRVCTQCGLAEEGWGCGHKLLAPGVYGDFPTIEHNKWLPWASKYVQQNGHISYYLS